MKTDVTIVPVDKVVVVDKKAMFLELPETSKVYHAIQWHGGKGHIEWKDGAPNTEIFGEKHYSQYIQPFVDLWEQEKARLEYEATRPRTEAELREIRKLEIRTRLNIIDFQLVRPLSEMANNTASDEDKDILSSLMEEKHSLRAELTTLTTDV